MREPIHPSEPATPANPRPDRPRIASHCICCGGGALASSPAVLMPFVAHRTFGWEPVVIDESWGLSTIRSGHAYSVCRSLACETCGTLFLDIRFSPDELANLYRDYRGEAYTRLRERYEPGYTARNAQLNAGVGYLGAVERFLAPLLAGPVRLLDWGGDTGENTPFKRQAQVFDIFDISDKAVMAGARRVTREQAEAGDYSLVVCSNVLEHVPFPLDLLMEIRPSLSADTVLYIEVPFEALMHGSMDARARGLQKRHWHEHVNFFTEAGLRRLVGQAGLEVLAFEVLSVDSGGRPADLFQVACRLARQV